MNVGRKVLKSWVDGTCFRFKDPGRLVCFLLYEEYNCFCFFFIKFIFNYLLINLIEIFVIMWDIVFC